MSASLTVLKYGDTVFGENYLFYGGNRDRLLPITFCVYLIQTEKRKILVDAGCDDGSGFPMSIFCTPLEALATAGLKAEDITDVIITHAHNDHIGAVHHFENAKIYIQKDEYKSGQKYIPQDFDVITFDSDCNIDGEIFIKKIGAHSPGSCIVLFAHGEKTAVICGDECYTIKNINEKIPTGATKNLELSTAFVNEYSKENYETFTLHDPEIMRGKVGATKMF